MRVHKAEHFTVDEEPTPVSIWQTCCYFVHTYAGIEQVAEEVM